jgi:hypothetical protein
VDEDGYFGEPIAAHYDQSTAEMGEPGAVDRVTGLLAELPATAGRWSWGSAPGGSPCRWRGAASPSTASTTSDSKQHVSVWE